MVAAAGFVAQMADRVLAEPLATFTEAMALCSDQDIERIISLASGTNTTSKYETINKATLKQIYDMIQLKEIQVKNLKQSMDFLTQLMVANTFALENGAIAWNGEGNNTLSTVCSAVLKAKCRRAGAAEARGAGNQ